MHRTTLAAALIPAVAALTFSLNAGTPTPFDRPELDEVADLASDLPGCTGGVQSSERIELACDNPTCAGQVQPTERIELVGNEVGNGVQADVLIQLAGTEVGNGVQADVLIQLTGTEVGNGLQMDEQEINLA